MDLDFAPLEVNSYLKQIFEITAQCEGKNNKIAKGEKEKSELEHQVKQLQGVKRDLELQKNNNILAVEKLKTNIFDLNEEIKCIRELENEYKISRKDAGVKLKIASYSVKEAIEKILWDLSQKVYTEIVTYCDKIQEFVEDYKFPEMINKIIYPGSIEMSFSNSIKDKKQEDLEKLKQIKEHLREELTALNNKQVYVKEGLEKKAYLKHWPSGGKEFLELQAAITKSKEESIKLHHDISELESKRKTKYFLRESNIPHLNINNDAAYNMVKTNEDKIFKINNWIRDASSKMEKRNSIHFVPKVVKHFKTSNS